MRFFNNLANSETPLALAVFICIFRACQKAVVHGVSYFTPERGAEIWQEQKLILGIGILASVLLAVGRTVNTPPAPDLGRPGPGHRPAQ